MRRLCKECGLRPVAVNYYKAGKPYFRSKCDHCARGGGQERPLWHLSGYKKKDVCDKCGFKSRHPEIFNVFYIDGNLRNNKITNLKTICANCQRVLHQEGMKWRQGDLTPDF